MNCAMSVHLGVYALGAADEAETTLVETHLAGCAACRAELARLEPLAGLLAHVPLSLVAADLPPAWLPGPAPVAAHPTSAGQSVPAGAAAPAGKSVPAREPGVARVSAGTGRMQRVRSRRFRALSATAAAAAAVGAAGGFWLARPGASPAPAAITLSGANPATHVRVTVTLTGTSWGTSIRLVARGLPLNVPCRLIVASRTGGTEVTGVWNAWSAGPVTIPASAGLRPADIASLRVATSSRNLVTVTVRQAAAPAPAASHPTR
jgi:anti-sigma factor RsiW